MGLEYFESSFILKANPNDQVLAFNVGDIFHCYTKEEESWPVFKIRFGDDIKPNFDIIGEMTKDQTTENFKSILKENDVLLCEVTGDKYLIEVDGEQRSQVKCRYILLKTKPEKDNSVVPPSDPDPQDNGVAKNKENEVTGERKENPRSRICKLIAIIIALFFCIMFILVVCVVAAHYNLVSQEVLQETVKKIIGLITKYGIVVLAPLI